ncbi:MAG: hypothetical protein JWQ98_556 [Chlorobi bacterium]|nr:hypothetical protein [Chlorobiota bacterium]
MWGDRSLARPAERTGRFIPTHVGRSPFSPFSSYRLSVHPHACGEISLHESAGYGAYGSSPRMWGDPVGVGDFLYRARFIPTHVGRSPSGTSYPTTGTVHPHACGEIAVKITATIKKIGSSPRMWGDPLMRFHNRVGCRFIPTHVGRSSCQCGRPVLIAVHPHACGEIEEIGDPQLVQRGSSPRMWGDRWRGWWRCRPYGSSPRMWGDPALNIGFGLASRFIPTHVGRSLRVTRGIRALPVHPHACGEIGRGGLPSIPFAGSSPRMWGDLLPS